MHSDDLQENVRESAVAMYSDGQEIWNKVDSWNSYKKSSIDGFCRRYSHLIKYQDAVLNAGCGSHDYDWIPYDAINTDLFIEQIRKKENPIVSDVSNLPFRDKAFYTIICVGSVINYTSAHEAISEFSRCLKKDGVLILHYETSDSFEHLGRSYWHHPVALIKTINSGRSDTIWVYSQIYIEGLLRTSNIKVVKSKKFHILSSLVQRLSGSQNLSTRYSRLDKFARIFKFFADDHIVIAKKTT